MLRLVGHLVNDPFITSIAKWFGEFVAQARLWKAAP
jgi:hypothetical protein